MYIYLYLYLYVLFVVSCVVNEYVEASAKTPHADTQDFFLTDATGRLICDLSMFRWARAHANDAIN